MLMNAIIKSKCGDTMILDLPRDIYDIHEALLSVGISQPPHKIPLTNEDGDDVHVKLYAESEVGKHLLLTLTDQSTLADANLLSFVVDNASRDIRSELERNIIGNQYRFMREVVDAVRQMTYDSGPVKVDFYCPLTGKIEAEDYDDYSPVGSRFLNDYKWAIEEALELDVADDETDMAEFFDRDDGVKAKLVSARWGVESYRGRLFGKIECSLKEPLTDSEAEILKEWIIGQNADGYGEHFEQQTIDTEDGDLYVSFWNSGDDYSIMAHDELDAYIENQGMTMGGM